VAEDVAAAGETPGSAWQRRDAGGRSERRRERPPAAAVGGSWYVAPQPGAAAADAAELVARVQRLMWERVGVERSGAGLAAAAAELAALSRRTAVAGDAFAAGEARNLLLAGRLLAQAALARRESRGGHYRADYPLAEAAWQRRRFLTATAGGAARFEPWPQEAAATDPRRPKPAPVLVEQAL